MRLFNSKNVDRRSVTLVALALLLALGAFLVWKNISAGKEGQDYIAGIDRMQAISPQMALSARAATEYDEAAFDELLVGVNDFTRTLDALIKGTDLPVNVDRLRKEIDQVRFTWGGMELDARVIAASKSYVFKLQQQAQDVNAAFDTLQPQYEAAADRLVRNGATSRSTLLVQRQSLLIEKARQELTGILAGQDAVATAERFLANANELVANHKSIVDAAAAGSRIAGMLRPFNSQVDVVESNAVGIFDIAPAVYRMGNFADSISNFSTTLLTDVAELNNGVDALFTERLYYQAAIVLAVLIAIAFFVYRRTDKRLQVEHAQNEENQEAILQLLDELDSLADGDLTANATVTESFTGAIADSINYAIEQMRSLVQTINTNSQQVSQSAEETRSTANYLTKASAEQSTAITNATTSINEIANSMDEVATNADQSSNVASNSVEIANKGAGAVQNTINGMDKIREQIQKTSKQIKRLGESSQEIGDIVSLINDISDQTNILSLNAAIQASMAGDAGRGFAVVADEVQRLAERSGAATKQIEVLVKTIQADTNEAVISMEKTTAEVVQGARLAQDAGVALEEIEEVSNDLAKLIHDISEAAGHQSSAATEVSKTMGQIQKITSETSTGTQEAATSIGNLASLANGMRESVSGFTLPGEGTAEVNEPQAADESLGSEQAVADANVDKDDDQAASAA